MVSPISAGGGFTRTGIATIVDMGSREIEVDVNESYINRVRAGQKVEAVLDAYPDWEIPSHVISIVPTADRQKATVQGAHRLRRARPAHPVRTWASRSAFLDERPRRAERESGAAARPRVRCRRARSRATATRASSGACATIASSASRCASARSATAQVEVLAGVDAGDVVVATPVAGSPKGGRVARLSASKQSL